MTDTPHHSLTGQIAIVTGASRGIGRAITLGLADAGATVIAVARTTADLDVTVAAATDAGGSAVALTADVTEPDQVDAVVAEALARFGAVDLLVNNAGEAMALGSTWEVDPDTWWRTFDINVRGPFLFTRAALPSMLERGSGRVVNLISAVGWAPGSGYNAAYAASKAALIRFTESLAEEIAPQGLAAFALSPGIVETDLSLIVRRAKEERLGTPTAADARPYLPAELTAEVIVYLAGGDADGLSGHCLHVTDGIPELAARAAEIHAADLYQMRRRTDS